MIIIYFLLNFVTFKVFGQNSDYKLLLERYQHTINNENGSISFYISKNSKKIRSSSKIIYYWYAHGQLNITQGGYNGKLLNGLFSQRDSNGKLSETGNFSTGRKHGAWKKWNENGELLEFTTYRLGRRNGNYWLFVNGQIKEHGRYRFDQLDGKIVKHISNDSTVVLKYDKGILLKDIPLKRSLLQRIWKGKVK